MSACIPPLVEFVYDQGVLVVEPQPDLDRAVCEGYEDELKAAIQSITADPDVRFVVADMSQTHYFSSALLGLLVGLWKITKRRRGAFVMCGLSPFGQTVLEVARLHNLWPIMGSRAEALKTVRAARQFRDVKLPPNSSV